MARLRPQWACQRPRSNTLRSRMPPKKAPRMWAMETAKKILAGVEEVCISVQSVLHSYMRSLFFARSRSATAHSLPSPVSPPLCWNLTLHAYGRKRVSRTFVSYRLYRRTPFWREEKKQKELAFRNRLRTNRSPPPAGAC